MDNKTRYLIKLVNSIESFSLRKRELKEHILLSKNHLEKKEEEFDSLFFILEKLQDELLEIIKNYQPESDVDKDDKNLIMCDKCKKYYPKFLTTCVDEGTHNTDYRNYCYNCNPSFLEDMRRRFQWSR